MKNKEKIGLTVGSRRIVWCVSKEFVFANRKHGGMIQLLLLRFSRPIVHIFLNNQERNNREEIKICNEEFRIDVVNFVSLSKLGYRRKGF